MKKINLIKIDSIEIIPKKSKYEPNIVIINDDIEIFSHDLNMIKIYEKWLHCEYDAPHFA